MTILLLFIKVSVLSHELANILGALVEKRNLCMSIYKDQRHCDC